MSGPSFSKYRSARTTTKKLNGKKVTGKFTKKRSNSAPPLHPLREGSSQQKVLLKTMTPTELVRQFGTAVCLTSSDGTKKMNAKIVKSGTSKTMGGKSKTWWSATSFKHYKKSDTAKSDRSDAQCFKDLTIGKK
ncbi:unnamed protein product [Caenorhabditis brenneri]